VERHGAEGVGQRLLVPACTESGVPSWSWGALLIQRLWLEKEAGRRVKARCGHEGLQTLLSSGHGARVHSHVPLPRVAVGRPRCVGPTGGTSGAGGLARRATTTTAAVAVLAVAAAASTAIAVFVVVLVPVATGAAVSTIGWARRRGRRWIGRRGRNVGVERWFSPRRPRSPSTQPPARPRQFGPRPEHSRRAHCAACSHAASLASLSSLSLSSSAETELSVLLARRALSSAAAARAASAAAGASTSALAAASSAIASLVAVAAVSTAARSRSSAATTSASCRCCALKATVR
jgi:hypothetical protein